MKAKFLEELYDLRQDIQDMREEGETDLRSVLRKIDNKIYNVEKLEDTTDISHFIQKAHQTAIAKGWWEDEKSFPEQVVLMHSELSEAIEDFRDGKDFKKVYFDGEKPCGIAIELADTVIRIFDTCGKYGIDLQKAIDIKMAYNETRPHKHGGKKI